MQSKMQLNVEFLAGTNAREAIIEAREKARQLNLAYVCFHFNGCSFSIGANCDIDRVLHQYPTSKYIVDA